MTFPAGSVVLLRLLAITRATFGPEHLRVAVYESSFGNLKRRRGRLQEADQLLAHAVRIYETDPSSRKTGFASVLSNRGIVLWSAGKLEEAEDTFRRSLAINESTYVGDNQETARNLGNLGSVLVGRGRLAEAEPFWRGCYEKGRHSLGVDDPDVLVWTNNLGGLLSSMGRAKEAETYYREAYEGARRVHGEEYPFTLGAWHNQADRFRSPCFPSRMFRRIPAKNSFPTASPMKSPKRSQRCRICGPLPEARPTHSRTRISRRT